MDFEAYQLTTGRSFLTLTVLDGFIREATGNRSGYIASIRERVTRSGTDY